MVPQGGGCLNREREICSTNLLGLRYRAKEVGTPIFSQVSIYGHSAKEGKMYGGDCKRDMEVGVMAAEGSIISAGWVGQNFFSQGQGANLFISLEVTMKFY